MYKLHHKWLFFLPIVLTLQNGKHNPQNKQYDTTNNNHIH